MRPRQRRAHRRRLGMRRGIEGRWGFDLIRADQTIENNPEMAMAGARMLAERCDLLRDGSKTRLRLTCSKLWLPLALHPLSQSPNPKRKFREFLLVIGHVA